MAESQQKIEQPKMPPPQPGIEARVFTMPERYRHGAEASMHEPMAKKPAAPPIEVKTPAVPAPKAPPKPVVPKKASSTKKIIIAGVVALLVLGVGGFFLLRSADETPAPPTAPVTRPAPTPQPEKEPEEEPEEEPEGEPVAEPDLFPVEIVPGVDTDSDGLTDTEEELVYDTNPRLPDTDADGFLDGNEVFHRYNPGGTAPGTLLESGLVVEVSGVADGLPFAYSHPADWEREGIDTGWMLDSGTGEGFRITTMAKNLGETLETWLEFFEPDARPTIGVTKNGLPMAQIDQLTSYIDLGDLVFIFVYDTGLNARVDYLQTFQMMINSVEIGEDAEAAAPESAG
ncbi:hypothetical protein HY630_02205 [Candidatus Uhrbacteria bacterium]|nr:hypothetical protein [Candidatus Uhrbacteria bacterium]